MRILYLAAGILFLGLGLLGAVLPLLPTTIFLILAAGCFARSSPRLEAWLIRHPTFGPSVERWRERGAIAPQAKMLALSGMAFGFAVFLVTTRPGVPLAGTVAAALVACAWYVASRPNA